MQRHNARRQTERARGKEMRGGRSGGGQSYLAASKHAPGGERENDLQEIKARTRAKRQTRIIERMRGEAEASTDSEEKRRQRSKSMRSERMMARAEAGGSKTAKAEAYCSLSRNARELCITSIQRFPR